MVWPGDLKRVLECLHEKPARARSIIGVTVAYDVPGSRKKGKLSLDYLLLLCFVVV
jgi:hypothetical protein